MKRILASIIIAAAASTASADLYLQPHVTVKAGWTHLDLNKDSVSPPFDKVNNRDYTVSVLGTLFIHSDNAVFSGGIEGGYSYLGKYSTTDAGQENEARIQGFEAALIGRARVATGTHIFARYGALRWDTNDDELDNGTDAFWGAGATYGLDRLIFRASFDRYEIDDLDLESYTLGFQYLIE